MTKVRTKILIRASAVLVTAFSILGVFAARAGVEESLKVISANPEFVRIDASDSVAIDLRYASENNFMKRDLYGPFEVCYLHRLAAEKLQRAARALSDKKPGFKLLLLDCLRPRSIQWVLWDAVKGTPQQPYVGNPKTGSIHNFGFAIDLTVQGADGKELDMGTIYDFFGELAEPRHEDRFLKEGKLTAAQLANRRLLRDAMTQAGFVSIKNEWWHFDGLPSGEVRKKHVIVE